MEAIKSMSLMEHQITIDNDLLKRQFIIGEEDEDIKEQDNNRKKNKNDLKLLEKKAEEEMYNKMTLDLPLYQDKIKRDKDLYKEEFMKFLKEFKLRFKVFLESPNNNDNTIKDVIVFLSHLSHVFPKELSFLPVELKNLLEFSYNIIHPSIRLSIIESFNLLRKKNLIEPIE